MRGFAKIGWKKNQTRKKETLFSLFLTNKKYKRLGTKIISLFLKEVKNL